MMHSLTFILALLVTCALTCPPFNNDTLDENIGYFGPWFGNDQSGLWPKNDKGISLVPYCYSEQRAFDILSSQVGLGCATWYSNLDDPGADHGHSLTFERVYVPGGSNPWCYDASGNWNDFMPEDALVIKMGRDAEIGGETTVGHTKDGEAGRHYMKMGGASTDWDLAHELGHAFGLLHEHQRPDRDDYIEYQCTMLVDYTTALARAQADGHSADELCNNAYIAAKYGFGATQFTKNGELVDHSTASKQYDINSIMHYTSENYGDPMAYKDHRDDPEYYPLVTKDTGSGRQVIAQPEPFPDFDVTDLDIQGIKSMYPWSLCEGQCGDKVHKRSHRRNRNRI